MLTIADRFPPSLVFFISSILAALFNLAITIEGISSSWLLFFRFLTGFFLAGIYPVGMKIASDYYQKGLGKSLGFLVGALVLGTAFPHLLKSLTLNLPWKYIIFSTSALSVLGGFLVFRFVPNGPFRKPGSKLHLNSFLSGFKNKNFRSAAFGYFGHMWELYSFWAFVPVMLVSYKNRHPQFAINTSFLSFLIIASGSLACVSGGLLSQRFGVKKTASVSLALSGICCLASPVFLLNNNSWLLIGFLFFWALVVIADSPLFSTLVAQNAPEAARGSALTIVNCIGFAITIISIQFINIFLKNSTNEYVYTLLAIVPVFGLISLFRHKFDSTGTIPKIPE
jgi:MFS family permease